MNSSDEKNEMRAAATGQRDAPQKKYSPDDPGSKADVPPDRQHDRSTARPVKIGREQAEKNIPSDPDPDDPVSP